MVKARGEQIGCQRGVVTVSFYVKWPIITTAYGQSLLRQGGTQHIAHHDLQPELTQSSRHRQPLCETAALKLDVRHTEPTGESRDICETLHAFIRRDRHRGFEAIEQRLLPDWERLLDELYACLGPYRHDPLHEFSSKPLIGVVANVAKVWFGVREIANVKRCFTRSALYAESQICE